MKGIAEAQPKVIELLRQDARNHKRQERHHREAARLIMRQLAAMGVPVIIEGIAKEHSHDDTEDTS